VLQVVSSLPRSPGTRRPARTSTSRSPEHRSPLLSKRAIVPGLGQHPVLRKSIAAVAAGGRLRHHHRIEQRAGVAAWSTLRRHDLEGSPDRRTPDPWAMAGHITNWGWPPTAAVATRFSTRSSGDSGGSPGGPSDCPSQRTGRPRRSFSDPPRNPRRFDSGASRRRPSLRRWPVDGTGPFRRPDQYVDVDGRRHSNSEGGGESVKSDQPRSSNRWPRRFAKCNFYMIAALAAAITSRCRLSHEQMLLDHAARSALAPIGAAIRTRAGRFQGPNRRRSIGCSRICQGN